MTTPSAGWYPDPHIPGQERYWDGSIWTDQVRPLAGQAAPAPVSQADKNRATNKKVLKGVGIAVAAFVVLAIIGSALGSSDSNKTADTTPQSGQVSEPAQETTSPTPSPEAKPTQAPLWPTKTYSGRGDKILRVSLGSVPRAAIFTHRGSSNFAVTELGSGGDDLNIAVNAIGRYLGTVLLNSADDDTAALKIEADGRWTVTLKDLRALPAWNGTGTQSGTGDAIVRASTGAFDGLTSLRVTHAGESNFAVETYGTDSHDIVINEIGRYSGEVQIAEDTFLLVISADGRWTMART